MAHNSFIHATLLRLISIFGWIDAIMLRLPFHAIEKKLHFKQIYVIFLQLIKWDSNFLQTLLACLSLNICSPLLFPGSNRIERKGTASSRYSERLAPLLPHGVQNRGHGSCKKTSQDQGTRLVITVRPSSTHCIIPFFRF